MSLYVHAYSGNSEIINTFNASKFNIMSNYSKNMNTEFNRRLEGSFKGADAQKILAMLGSVEQKGSFVNAFKEVYDDYFLQAMSQEMESGLVLRDFAAGRRGGVSNKEFFKRVNKGNNIQEAATILNQMVDRAGKLFIEQKEYLVTLGLLNEKGQWKGVSKSTLSGISKYMNAPMTKNGGKIKLPNDLDERAKSAISSYRELKRLNDKLKSAGNKGAGGNYASRIKKASSGTYDETVLTAFSGLLGIFSKLNWQTAEIAAEVAGRQLKEWEAKAFRGGQGRGMENAVVTIDPELGDLTKAILPSGSQSEDVSIFVNKNGVRGVIGVQVKNYQTMHVDLKGDTSDKYTVGQRSNFLDLINKASRISHQPILSNKELYSSLTSSFAHGKIGNRYSYSSIKLDEIWESYVNIIIKYNMLEYLMGSTMSDGSASIGFNNIVYILNNQIFTVSEIMSKVYKKMNAGGLSGLMDISGMDGAGSNLINIRHNTTLMNMASYKTGGFWQESPKDKQKRSDLVVAHVISEFTKSTIALKFNLLKLMRG